MELATQGKNSFIRNFHLCITFKLTSWDLIDRNFINERIVKPQISEYDWNQKRWKQIGFKINIKHISNIDKASTKYCNLCLQDGDKRKFQDQK